MKWCCPTATDLAAKLDPVLSRAAAIVGVKIEPKEAGLCSLSNGESSKRY